MAYASILIIVVERTVETAVEVAHRVTDGLRIVIGIAHNNAVELTESGTCRDKVTADDVLLHALEIVGLAGNSSFVEYLGGFLEGSG